MNHSTHLFNPSKHPFWDGFSSIGSISGLSSKYRRYLRGNAVSDMLRDWQMVGYDLKDAFHGAK
jgi:hypothetical protein